MTDISVTPEWLPDRRKSYVIFGFTGQGQQRPDMFEPWYEYGNPDVDRLLKYFHQQTGTEYGQPLDPEELERGPLMQPANVTLGVIGSVALASSGIRPNETFGHSLGEIPAASCAGFIDPERAIWLARKRGECTDRAIKQLDDREVATGMMAVLRSGEELSVIIPKLFRSLDTEDENTGVSNFNSDDQYVLSGDRNVLQNIFTKIKNSKIARAIMLKVDGAYHSDYMKPAAIFFRPFVDELPIAQPERPALHSPTTKGQLSTRDQVAKMLVDQLTSAVYYHQLIDKRLQDLNNEKNQKTLSRLCVSEVVFVEVGAYAPSKPTGEGVLINLNKKNVQTYHRGNTPIRYHRVSVPEDVTSVRT